ncbi:MAG: hypothetical protein ACTTIS_00305 [Streptobacillus sp.]
MSRGYQLKADELFDTIDQLCNEVQYDPYCEDKNDQDELWWRYIDQDENYQQQYQ